LLLGFGVDQITVMHQFANQGIDLAQTQGGLWTTLEVATHETVFVHAHLEGCRASLIDGSGAILFGERKNAEDAPHTHFALLAIDKVSEYTDMGAHSAGAAEQLHHTDRSLLGVVLGLNAVPALFLTHMFSQE
jgi:hypothetical protein